MNRGWLRMASRSGSVFIQFMTSTRSFANSGSSKSSAALSREQASQAEMHFDRALLLYKSGAVDLTERGFLGELPSETRVAALE